ncbi:MAG UNVERIFIED_CONTAM: hypothetical protein LVT10_25580 [Anaerolineae bacterium]|jgi:predicted helicase
MNVIWNDLYKKGLFANEIMLMPYYIASLNIETVYFNRREGMRPLKICPLWTRLTLPNRAKQACSPNATPSASNASDRHRSDVIIGNPPYNAGQSE